MITAIFIIPSTMLATVSALSAQNIGAKDYGRARTVLKYAVIITTLYGIIVALIVECAAPTLLGLFTKDTTVILLGVQYISSYIIDTIFAGIHFSFSGYFAKRWKELYWLYSQYYCYFISQSTRFLYCLSYLSS